MKQIYLLAVILLTSCSSLKPGHYLVTEFDQDGNNAKIHEVTKIDIEGQTVSFTENGKKIVVSGSYLVEKGE